MSSRLQQQAKRAALAQAAAQLAEQLRTQEPAFTWLSDEEILRTQTGVGLQTFDLLRRSTEIALGKLHGRRIFKQNSRSPLLSPANLLLLYLFTLRHNPTVKELGLLFNTAFNNFDLVHKIASIVAPELEQYVHPPERVRRTIQKGALRGAALLEDTTTIPILRPGAGQAEDRALFFYGKTKKWAEKFQVTVGLDATIWEHSLVKPSSVSDRQIFEQSSVPILLEEKHIRGIGDSHYVNCTNIFGKKVGRKQRIAHEGYNREIEHARALIENVFSRLKMWKIIQGPWRMDRHDADFLNQVAGSVCGLLNLEIHHRKPVRKNLQTVKPTATQLLKKTKKRKRSNDSDQENLI